MERLQGWQLAFVAAVLGSAAVVLGYVEVRRLLFAAVDDRYGQWRRFWAQASEPTAAGRGLGTKLNYAVAFFFCYGVHDLTRFLTLLAFDLFVIFALLSPFWRYVFFDDWNPALAAGIALALVSMYVAWKVRQGLQLCRVHEWSGETWQCVRCGEYHARAEELGRKKTAKTVVAPATGLSWSRLSWHGFWRRRLEDLNERLLGE